MAPAASRPLEGAAIPKDLAISDLQQTQQPSESAHTAHTEEKHTSQRKHVKDASKDKENSDPAVHASKQRSTGQKHVNWKEFTSIIAQAKLTPIDLSYIVDLEDLCLELEADRDEKDENETGVTEEEMERLTIEAVARQIARKVWDLTDFRFIYKTTLKSTTDETVKTFQFYCAQFDAEKPPRSTLHADVNKRRARNTMEENFAASPELEFEQEDSQVQAASSPAHIHERSSPFCSDDEGESSKRMFFSSEYVEHTEENIQNMLGIIKQSQGVHPKLGKILKRAFDELNKTGKDITKEKRRRTTPRTWKDSNSVTLFMD
ncbi:hypothetical protein D9757_004922 [Collybiopsis confluens]|uniref:Uncharacterized protein n=1 Tax=Collybiopsis confluens TaxID=2823264 RepID=A0A8H5HT49_9AGAR|nr:hypothetical protein D9757_004922 [Collybiopsis confluens]